jgi:hypothetical protein
MLVRNATLLPEIGTRWALLEQREIVGPTARDECLPSRYDAHSYAPLFGDALAQPCASHIGVIEDEYGHALKLALHLKQTGSAA